MSRLLTWPRYAGPLITLALIGFNQLLIAYGLFPVQVAWLYVPVAFAALTGLRAGLASAMLVAIYSAWLNPADPQRTIVIPTSLAALAVGVGLQSRSLRNALADARRGWDAAAANEVAAAALGDINGNILRIRHARDILMKTLEKQPLNDLTREELHTALHTLNNLELATAGWQALERLKASIETDRAKAEVVGRQKMEDLKAELMNTREKPGASGQEE